MAKIEAAARTIENASDWRAGHEKGWRDGFSHGIILMIIFDCFLIPALRFVWFWGL